MAAELEVSVVVPCHGAARTLPALLDALERQTLDPARFEIVLVEPGADGGHRVVADRLHTWKGAEVRIVPSPLPGGPGLKRNIGAAVARGRVLAFTDADCLPEPGWLEAGLGASNAGYDLVQGFVLAPEGQSPTRLAHWIIVDNDHGLYETANIFYARRLFRELGGFSTRYYTRYDSPFGEDAELGWRAIRAGARYRLEEAAVVRHPVSEASLRAHLRGQWLARGFPQLVRELPELREALLYRRMFLTRESAQFACAAAGTVAARRWRPAGLLALPYATALIREARGRGALDGARAAAAKLLSDGTLFAGLVWGGTRARRLVL